MNDITIWAIYFGIIVLILGSVLLHYTLNSRITLVKKMLLEEIDKLKKEISHRN